MALLAIIPGLSGLVDIGQYLPSGFHESDAVAMGTFAILALMMILVGMGKWMGETAIPNSDKPQ